MDPAITQQMENLDGLTAEELGELESQLVEAGEALAEASTPEEIAELTSVVEALETVRAKRAADAQAEADLAAKRDELMAKLNPAETTEEQEPEAEPEETPEETAEDETETPVAVAASPAAPTPPARNRPRITSVKGPTYGLTAAADLPNVGAGAAFKDKDRLADAFSARARAAMNSENGSWGVVHAESDNWPKERDLRGLSAMEITKRIQAVLEPSALTAASLCTPATPRYDLIDIGNEDRPVLGALPSFRADRGAVHFVKSPTLSDVDVTGNAGSAIKQVNHDDVLASKPCQVLNCGDTDTAYVYAVTQCLRVNNWQYSFFREQFNQFWRLVGIAHARKAEQLMLSAMETASTTVNGTHVLGTARDVLTHLEQLGDNLHNHYRDDSVRVRAIMPAWLSSSMETDFLRQVPGDDKTDVTDSEIDGLIRGRGVEPVWSLDYQPLAVQGAGAAVTWPLTVDILVFLEGTFFALDGGTIDFGLVRDSVLNATNEFVQMSEGFEGIGHFGLTAYKLHLAICPTGATSAPVTVTCGPS